MKNIAKISNMYRFYSIEVIKKRLYYKQYKTGPKQYITVWNSLKRIETVCYSSYEILGLSETAQNSTKQAKEVQIDPK